MYTDPGSGTLVWQILLAGFIGTLYKFRQALARIRPKKDMDNDR